MTGRWTVKALATLLLLVTARAHAQHQLEAEELRRFAAAEAHQGVAVDDRYFYALDNAAIGQYDKTTGARVAGWQGAENGSFMHLNSCKAVAGALLRCAHSNSPNRPTASSVEIFKTAPLRPIQ